jgi:hypothetical protein
VGLPNSDLSFSSPRTGVKISPCATAWPTCGQLSSLAPSRVLLPRSYRICEEPNVDAMIAHSACTWAHLWGSSSDELVNCVVWRRDCPRCLVTRPAMLLTASEPRLTRLLTFIIPRSGRPADGAMIGACSAFSANCRSPKLLLAIATPHPHYMLQIRIASRPVLGTLSYDPEKIFRSLSIARWR